MPYMTLDLETVTDPGMPAYAPRSGDDTFPPAPYWQIVCIGQLWADDQKMTKAIGIRCLEGSERDMLSRLVRDVDKHRPELVTFNGRRFDLPVISARCMRHGVAFPARFGVDVTHRYREEGHLDIADVLTDHGAGKHASLDAWAKLIGMPGKLDACGADVAQMVAEGRLADVQTYCMGDVVQTWAVRLRFDLVRGRLDCEAYLVAMRSLVDAVAAHPRLLALAEAMNLKRLLLED